MAHHLSSQLLASRRHALSLFALATVLIAAVACGSNGDNGGAPGTGSVQIQVEVEGAGSIEAPELEFACRGSCTLRVDAGERVVLRAVPDAGQFAVAWEGSPGSSAPCGALEERCEWVASDNVRVGMAFAPNVLRLEVVGDGVGRFVIAHPPETTTCRGSCGVGLEQPLGVAITYFPDGSRTTLGPWEADCTIETDRYCSLAVSGLVTVGTTWLHPPLARDEEYTTNQETILEVAAAVGLLANASDTPGDTLRAALAPNSEPSHGTLELEADGSFRYEPDADFSGVDSFEYLVIDAFGNQDDAEARITVRPRLVLEKSGAGSGSVTSEPAGIDCGATCQSDHLHVDDGDLVVLRAVEAGGSVFTGWGGACSDSGADATCAIVVRADAVSTATVTAAFERSRHTLLAQAEGLGVGNIVSDPPGLIDLDAGSTSHVFEYGAEISLRAVPARGSTFEGWDGPCTHDDLVCTFTITDDTTVAADFGIAVYTLTVASPGLGSGNVVSDPPGLIDLGVGVGSADLEFGTEIRLEARAGFGSVFEGWGGACSEFGSDLICELTITADSHVSAVFGLDNYTLVSTIVGTGFGRVTSSPPGINHTTEDEPMSAEFVHGTPITLTASTMSGTNSTFIGWGGACSAFTNNPVCLVTLTSDDEVSAEFGRVKRTLTVQRVGGNGGNVTSDPPGIDLDAGAASAPFEIDSTVELRASERTGWTLSSWGGACAASGADLTCSVTMSENLLVTVTYERIRHTIESRIEGEGSGRVTSDPGSIDHTTKSDSDEFDFGTPVTLTAAPLGASSFAGWGDDCADWGQELQCEVTVKGDVTVSARFDP